MDVCNQLSNELKLENKIEQFKEALQEVIRKHDFREVTTYSECIRPISGNLEIPDGKSTSDYSRYNEKSRIDL
jgi:hypothetical protein